MTESAENIRGYYQGIGPAFVIDGNCEVLGASVSAVVDARLPATMPPDRWGKIFKGEVIVYEEAVAEQNKDAVIVWQAPKFYASFNFATNEPVT